MTHDFREPLIWLLLAILVQGITEIVAFVLLDQDLIKHSRAEADVEDELSVIYGRLGQQVPAPDQGQVKEPDNYAGRIVATLFSAISVRSAGSQARTASAWVKAISAVMAAGLGATTCC